MNNGTSPTLADIRGLLERDGKHPVLLHIDARQKGPHWKGWTRISYEETLAEDYQAKLARCANTGILLGGASNDLCAVDCDTDAFRDAFLDCNPRFKETLRSRGQRGCQFWIYCTGTRPHKAEELLKAHKDSPLAVGAKEPLNKEGNPIDTPYRDVGEFRAEGGQSVLRGIHPSGCHYTWLVANPPITINFDEIRWPNDILIPWGEPKAKERETEDNDAKNADLLKRAIATITVDTLWDLAGFPPKNTNPVDSPFRTDNTKGHPSFSIYDEGRRFKDHNSSYVDHRGDSYNFYQLWTGLNSHDAFAPFVKLAGLEHELRKLKDSSKTEDEEYPFPHEPEERSEPELTDEELTALHTVELERYQFKERSFPEPMGEEAFYRIAGEIVGIISPVSEASREATLVQFLVAFGNLIGRGAHRKQAGIHHLNEDTVIVGETAIARKGSSWVPLHSLLHHIDSEWTDTRIKDGFQSGESVIHAVRDPIYGTIPMNKRRAGQADEAEAV
jgi:hypothetical protein